MQLVATSRQALATANLDGPEPSVKLVRIWNEFWRSVIGMDSFSLVSVLFAIS